MENAAKALLIASGVMIGIMILSLGISLYTSMSGYVESMQEGQENIYYASAKNKEAVLVMPQMDLLKSKGYNVLVLTDEVDEFMLQVMMEYKGKKFKSISQGDLDLIDKVEEEKIKELSIDKKAMLESMKEALEDNVSEVVLSKRLTDSPVCLVSKDGLSFEMEKVLDRMPNAKDVKADKVLEINPKHQLFDALERLFNDNDPAFKDYAKLLYQQALLIEGFKLDDPVEFSNKMCELMIKSSKYQ